MPRPRIPFIALLFPLLAAASGATAADAGQAASPPTFATPEQLRTCLDTEAALKTRAAALQASNKARQQLSDQVDAEEKSLAKERAHLDRSSDAAVAAFNGRATEHNEHVRRLKKDTADLRPANDAYRTAMANYNQTCGAQVARPEDMDAVTKERKKAP